ncbi:phosphoglycerate mutase [Schizopora paradoxa]|uniref:Phosphoglycerate mutase n=1 Tax=Schizopora paradoxa TaxID=27342 RepID=A0A0H2RRQ3_9AGAM|nr:phosphoglycerate mutase [Schizopora paradoxa]
MDSKYSIVPGFFAHPELEGLLPLQTASLPPRFGLVDESQNRWQTFLADIEKLNTNAPPNVSYKAIFAGRHGEGWHNVAEAKYGTEAWEEKWAALEGDGEITWGPDPNLTPLGVDQAKEAHKLWEVETSRFGLPLPARFFCSPLTRALETFTITFEGIVSSDKKAPLVMENCREQYGVHTCDKRRSASYITSTFPDVVLEHNFSDEDPLYSPDWRESHSNVARRAKKVLDYIFFEDDVAKDEVLISITAHSGFINGLVAVTGHPKCNLPTGGILPMVVKCTKSSQSTD